MSEKGNKSVDIHIHGLEFIGEAANTLAKGAVNFLSKICSPFAEEYGLYLQDKVKNWRVNNFAKIAQEAERKLDESGGIGEKSAHPRMVFQVFEHGSWIEDDNVQEMWAGLLASSCTETGKDDSNLIFTNLLSQLTTPEARILNYSCEQVEKELTKAGFIMAKNPFKIDLEKLKEVSGIYDFHRLDRELDHLRSLDLIYGGFPKDSTIADITPTPLALNMFVKCQGSLQSPVEFFGLDTSINKPSVKSRGSLNDYNT